MRRTPCLVLALAFTAPALVHGQAPPSSPAPQTIAARTQGLIRVDGYMPFYWDAARGRLLLEVSRFDQDVLYFATISKGIGSVELGVDRGAGQGSAVLRFRRIGPRVLIEEQNLQYRAPSGNAALKQGMAESFASSILASLPVEAEEGDRALVDATSLVVRDAGNLEGLLRQRGQGTFRLDANRSAINLSRTKAFPRNTEIDVTLTFTSDQPGPLVSRVAPDGRALTVGLRHSFVEPPDDTYQPRRADPRIAVGALSYKDYSAPYNQGTQVRWVRRWRLEKKDPAAAVSEPVTPIVFYLDPGIPEPIRTGMREGTLWWNRAFEAAGFRTAVQVRDPGPEIDPADIRYSYILWVNRDERGFSVGGSFSDPRTGEMLAAKPRMDSHRIRTIGNYWDAYRPSLTTGGSADPLECGLTLADEAALAAAMAETAKAKGHPGAGIPPVSAVLRTDDEQAAITSSARTTEESFVVLRQALVTAHEVGHTLGFGHNWTSSINDRASVMEYPTPRLTITQDGRIDLSDAYQRDIGDYDIAMVRFAYATFPAGQEAAGLEAIVRETRAKGLLFTPSSDPRWNRYDDLASPAEYLRQSVAQRRILLDRYGPDLLQAGDPVGELRDIRLWMTYLHHRWAIETGVRYVGGMYDNIALKGENVPPTEIVPVALQREVLGLLLNIISPEGLAMPETLLANLGSAPGGRDLEEFNSAAGYAFDHLSAARTLTAMVVEQLLEPERAARLVVFADRQPNALTFPEMIEMLVKGSWGAADATTPRLKSLQRVARRATLDAMMILGAHAQATPEVRAVVLQRLARLAEEMRTTDPDAVAGAMYGQARDDIRRYLTNPAAHAPKSSALPAPPGAPLGGPIP